jgi:polyisoprenoid-binding protein YceI
MSMRSLVLAVIVLAAPVAFCAAAQSARAQTRAVAQDQVSSRFTLDSAHTQVAFSVERFGFNHVLGRFDVVTGEVVLDEANPENSSVVATIQTASISSGNVTRDGHLAGARWLDVEQFPTMAFRSTSVRRTGAQTADVVGNLTLHGVTHPVTLSVTLNQIGRSPSNGVRAAGFSATAVVSRARFGMSTAANLIGDEVRITIEALGELPAAPAQ